MQNYNPKLKIKKITTILIIFNLLIGMFLIFQPNRLEFSKAAIFDAPLLPGNDNQYNLGSAASDQRWQNGFFSGNLTTTGNVSIGTTTIQNRLYVNNGSIAQKLKSETGISTMTQLNLENRPNNIYVSGKYAYIVSGSGNKFQIIDISSVSSPKIVGSIDLFCGGKIYVSGRYAYISSNCGRLYIVDVSNPSAPQIINSSTTPANSSVFISGHYAYLINPYSSQFLIMDVADPINPFLTASSSIGSSINRSIYVSGRYAYISGYFPTTASLGIVDISNPFSPKIIGNYSIDEPSFRPSGTEQGLYVSGPYAYMTLASYSYTYDLFTVINISNPNNPQIFATTTMPDATYSFKVAGNYIYAVHDNPLSEKNLSIIDISNPKNPKTIVANYQTGYRSIYIDVSGKYAYIINYNPTAPSMTILDISGLESVSANIHSLEAGNLQVRNDIIAQGQLQVSGGINVGTGGIFSAGPIGISIASTTQTDAISAYFQGRVGIATTTPTQKLEVNGGIRLNPDGSEPDSVKPATCDISIRGLLWFTPNSVGADTLEVCNASSTAPGGYDWRKLY